MRYAFNELEDRNFYSGERLRNRIETLDGPRVRLSTERDVKHCWVQWSCMYGANFRWTLPNEEDMGAITLRFTGPTYALIDNSGRNWLEMSKLE